MEPLHFTSWTAPPDARTHLGLEVRNDEDNCRVHDAIAADSRWQPQERIRRAETNDGRPTLRTLRGEARP